MPLQNRVLPTGEIVSHTSKAGLFMGNRGILHDASRTLGKSRWKHKNWIICVTEFKGRERTPMTDGTYTELFFLDDAVALAAGHRPCGECRRKAYDAYKQAFPRDDGSAPSSGAIDTALHRSRVNSRSRAQITHEASIAALPHGAFIGLDGLFWLVFEGKLLRYTPFGYDDARAKPDGMATVLTPRPSIEALRRGFVPVLHPSAMGL